MMWFLWQFMSSSPAPLLLTAMMVQPIDLQKLQERSSSKPSHERQPLSLEVPAPAQEASQAQLSVALAVFQELLRFHQVAGNLADIATTWFRLGDIYQQINQFSHAFSSYHQAIAHYQVVGDVKGEAIALSHLGKAYENRGWFDCALEHYEQALAKIRQTSEGADEATTLSHLAAFIEDMF
jgi:tetratricopeptide (TPR) repeat protein